MYLDDLIGASSSPANRELSLRHRTQTLIERGTRTEASNEVDHTLILGRMHQFNKSVLST
jgi:hypothetical protein